MKKPQLFFIIVFALFIMSCNSTDASKEASNALPEETGDVEAVLRSSPFSKGVNFSGWFETFNAQAIPFTKYGEQDFADVKSLGADVIRLPIRMHSMTGPAPDYRIDPLLFKFLDIAVSWAEKYKIYLIIDNHSFDPVKATTDDIDKILLPVWAQVAQRYKDSGDFIVYEILNEPHGISDSRWGEVQGMAVETIRKVDKKHAIIVGGTDYNSIGKLSAIPEYSDDNIIFTFHFYDPYLFTHQGETWGGEVNLGTLEGVPFPYDYKRMPKTPAKLKGTWVEGSLGRYMYDAAPSKLYGTLDKVVAFSNERSVPVFCGEFGVYLIQSPREDRARWYKFITAAMDRRNISRTSWDYYGGFGVFNTRDGGDFNSSLNVEVVSAMGFTPPVQVPRNTDPVDSGFVIYDDYPNRKFSTGYWGADTDFSLYDTNAAEGEFAIRWGNAEQYNVFWFGFDGNGNFSALAENGCIEFMARTEESVRFDVRFVNPESASSKPWRMRYTINDSILPPDGRWHTIRIPFRDMREHGAWVNAKQEWLSPQGEFSWSDVRQLEFVAEDEPLTGRVWFDSIKITR